MSRQSDAEEIYEIAKNARGPITFSDLADMLGYKTPHGVSTRVSSAYWYYHNEGDEVACETILRTFVKSDGTGYAW